MYIAGLHSVFTSPQGVEGIAVLVTADFFRHLLRKSGASKVATEEDGGPSIPQSAPRSLLDKFVFSAQASAALLPPTVYCTGVVFNNFRQSDWMLKLALPDEIIRSEWKTPVRLAACVAGFSLRFALDRILGYSDERCRMIGRRGKLGMTQTGPYTVVRHPAYSVMLLQQAFYSIMYWSYVPLVSLGILVGVFAIKMPLEEKAAKEDDITGNGYTEYTKRVPARVIPYIW